MTDPRIDNMLDECLEAVLARGERLDEAISRFPGHEAELRPLLALALRSSEVIQVSVPPATVSANRSRVMAGVDEIVKRRALEQGVVAGPPRRKRFFLKPLAWVTAAFVLLSSGTALAASGSEPGSFLYPVKQRMEQARTALSWQNLDRARTEVGHADERIDEIYSLATDGNRDFIPDILYRYELHLDAAVGYVNKAAAEGEDVSEILTMIHDVNARYKKMLRDLKEDAPEDSTTVPFKKGQGVIGGSNSQSSYGTGGSGGDEGYEHSDDASDDYHESESGHPDDDGHDSDDNEYRDSGSSADDSVDHADSGDHVESDSARGHDSTPEEHEHD